MAAYAAVVSLMNTVDAVLNHPRLSASLDHDHTKSLLQKADFFLHFLENSHAGLSKQVVKDWESQIASAAHAAEVLIEFHMADLIRSGSRQKFESIQRELQEIIEEDMDSIMEKIIKLKEESGFEDRQPTNSEPEAAASSRALSRAHTAGTTSMVGFDHYLHQLLDWLTRDQSERKIIPITGMGGIGKTTLARNTYQHSLIVHHFDVRAWVTVSQEYSVKQIISETLSCLRVQASDEEEENLGVQLHKFLFGRRYLIILDDMWSIRAWEKVMSFFPENDNRSRIIVTTRQPEVANYFCSSALSLSLLHDDYCWHLFCEKAFAQEDCPPELEQIGRSIVKNCKGHPLSIVVIGGLLAKSSRTKEYWRNVENDFSSILVSAEDNLCLNMLSLSYSYLPAHLKPCFLYLGTFPEDYEIDMDILIKLWVAEGFLKPKSDQSLEKVAEGYIKDFVDRNLILVSRLGWDDKCDAFRVHDLIRELCITTAEKEKFFCVISGLDASRTINREGRIQVTRVQEDKRNYSIIPPFESSLAYSGIGSQSDLLRVSFKASDYMNFDVFRSLYCYTDKQVSFRFLRGYISDSPSQFDRLPLSISQFWNLQSLLLQSGSWFVAPAEIWEMPQLRHVEIRYLKLSDPPPTEKQDHVVLRNLHTLKNVSDFRWSEEICERMPNIKKLEFFCSNNQTMSYCCMYNIGHFNKLESLRCSFNYSSNLVDLQRDFKFSSSLKELTLINCGLHWGELTMIGSLPHLEFLDLRSVKGSEWNPVEGEFLCLKFLKISDARDLISWNADSSHFPVLEKLRLSYMENLDEIPSGIGDIGTLGLIDLYCCSISSAISTVKIVADQKSYGNEGLLVKAVLYDHNSLEKVKEKVEEVEDFPTHNFRLFSYFGLPVANSIIKKRTKKKKQPTSYAI